jgi:hypothetical protein
MPHKTPELRKAYQQANKERFLEYNMIEYLEKHKENIDAD